MLKVLTQITKVLGVVELVKKIFFPSSVEEELAEEKKKLRKKYRDEYREERRKLKDQYKGY